MAWDALQFGERSTGNLSVPLWLPQGIMALGILIFTIALVDDLVRVVRGAPTSYPDDAAPLDRVFRRAPIASAETAWTSRSSLSCCSP